MKMGGMVLMPKSKRPFTPNLESSNSFTTLARPHVSFFFFLININIGLICK